MISRICMLMKKHRGILLYMLFGVLTTVVNYIVYLPLYNSLALSAAISNSVAWIAAVAVAFLTNKPFVFKSYDWSMKVVLPELTRFVACRMGSGLLETLCIFVTVDLLSWNGNIMKLLTSVIVVVLNYVFSKLIVFQK